VSAAELAVAIVALLLLGLGAWKLVEILLEVAEPLAARRSHRRRTAGSRLELPGDRVVRGGRR